LISPKANNGLLQPWLQHDDDDDEIQIASHIYVQHKMENYCYHSYCLLIDSNEIDSQINQYVPLFILLNH